MSQSEDTMYAVRQTCLLTIVSGELNSPVPES